LILRASAGVKEGGNRAPDGIRVAPALRLLSRLT
jgi:hypothetical protein